MLLAIAACVAMSDADAGLYKCAGHDGVPVYQEAPCPKGSELRNLNEEPPTLSVVPAPKPPKQAQENRPEKPARNAAHAPRVDRPDAWKVNPRPVVGRGAI